MSLAQRMYFLQDVFQMTPLRWSLFWDTLYINHPGLFNAKDIFVEEVWWYYLTNSYEYKRVHAFP